MYTFRNLCLEDSSLDMGDEATKIFLNSKEHSNSLDPDIAAFLRYVDGNAVEGAFVRELDKEVQRIKRHDETRQEYMTLAMELRRQNREGYKAGKEAGKKEGLVEGKALTALEMLQDGLPIETIAKYTKLSVEYITELSKSHNLL